MIGRKQVARIEHVLDFVLIENAQNGTISREVNFSVFHKWDQYIMDALF